MKKYLIPFLLVFISCNQTQKLGISLPDYSPYFQHEIDSCIANHIQHLYIPSGRYPCKEPLILQNYQANQGAYWPFSLIIEGESTFAGADGSGTILDFSSMTDGFGIGIQGGKGVEIHGLKLIGAWNYTFPGAKIFYNTSLSNFTDGKCRDTRYSPYFAVVIDPFGPVIPSDGGYPKDSIYYRGSTNGSTGTVIEDCYFTNWVGGIITSPNGRTQNAELTIADKIQFGNMKICVAGCQSQEKMNRISNVMCWGVVHTCFATGFYGAGSIGAWDLDHWNIAGYTNEIAYNNQSGYFPSYFDHIYAESIGRVGFIATTNGTKFINSTLNFAGYVEAGSYTTDMISGYGVTFDGCQLRIYGQGTPVTINTGAYANNFHFINCSFDCIPYYPQNYGYGYSDFLNCYVGGQSSANVLNPFGPSGNINSMYAYPLTSNLAAKVVWFDMSPHNITGPVLTSGIVKIGQPIIGTINSVTTTIVGIVSTIIPGGFTLAYTDSSIDTTKLYYLGSWVTIMK